MARALRSYMKEETTAFQLDDALQEIDSGTADETVSCMAEEFWYHYDDLVDHKIVATREQWALFNRLLLLLESDAELRREQGPWSWQPPQMVAAVLLATWACLAIRAGWGPELFLWSFLFGPPSMLLSWYWRRQQRRQFDSRTVALLPFPSVSSLSRVRRSVRGFVRLPWQRSVSERQIRSKLAGHTIWIRTGFAWCLFSPIALLFQAVPDRATEIVVETKSAPTRAFFDLP